MFKLVLEKAEEPEIKLPTSTGSSKKQESSRILVFYKGLVSVTCDCPTVPTPFIEKTVLYPFCFLGVSVKNELTVKVWVDFWVLCSIPLIYSSGFVSVLELFEVLFEKSLPNSEDIKIFIYITL